MHSSSTYVRSGGQAQRILTEEATRSRTTSPPPCINYCSSLSRACEQRMPQQRKAHMHSGAEPGILRGGGTSQYIGMHIMLHTIYTYISKNTLSMQKKHRLFYVYSKLKLLSKFFYKIIWTYLIPKFLGGVVNVCDFLYKLDKIREVGLHNGCSMHAPHVNSFIKERWISRGWSTESNSHLFYAGTMRDSKCFKFLATLI